MTEEPEWLDQQRAQDNQAYGIAHAIVAVLKRAFFTLPLYYLLRWTTPMDWALALTLALLLSFPAQFLFKRWLEAGE